MSLYVGSLGGFFYSQWGSLMCLWSAEGQGGGFFWRLAEVS